MMTMLELTLYLIFGGLIAGVTYHRLGNKPALSDLTLCGVAVLWPAYVGFLLALWWKERHR